MKRDETRPKGRGTVLVTGAGSGIGAAIARKLLESGYDLVIGGRRREPLEAICAYARAHGRDVVPRPLDLSSRDRTDAFVESLREEEIRLDGLILNAGINGKTPLEGDGRVFDEQVEVNLASCFRLVRALLPSMNDQGRILAVASVLARVGIPHYHGYCATKSGLVGLMRALALELAPRGIACASVLPGWTETEMAERSMAEQAPDLGLDADAARAHFLANVPMGRMLEPAEIAEMVAYLLGPGGMTCTGQALVIDGGTLA